MAARGHLEKMDTIRLHRRRIATKGAGLRFGNFFPGIILRPEKFALKS